MTAMTPNQFVALLTSEGIPAGLDVFGGPGYPAVPNGLLPDGRGWILTGDDGCFLAEPSDDAPMDEPLFLGLYRSEAENEDGVPFSDLVGLLPGCTPAQAAAAIRQAARGDYSAFGLAAPEPPELARTRHGRPMFDDQTRTYLRAARLAHPARIAPWRTPECPECWDTIGGEGLVIDGDGGRAHVVLRGSVILGCEGYLVINPAALGMDPGQWQDWRGSLDAAYINLQPAAGQYPESYGVTLYGADEGSRPTYPEALALLRERAADLDPERLEVFYMSHYTGLIVRFPVPLPEIAADWDRPARLEDAAWFAALPPAVVGVEALCLLCGQTCNPHGPDDMIHGEKMPDDDRTGREEPCGGPLVPVGWWGGVPDPEPEPVPMPDQAEPQAEPQAETALVTLTAGQVAAIMLAVQREVSEHATWRDCGDMTIAGLCYANQDALIDDLHERHPDDEPHRAELAALVRTYDDLLGTRRAGTLPADLLP